MLSLILGALFFAGIHLGIAGTQMRDRAIGILGENGYSEIARSYNVSHSTISRLTA